MDDSYYKHIPFKYYIENRIKNPSINLIDDITNGECIVLKNNNAVIKNTNIYIVKYIDYGATSIIFLAHNKDNNMYYILKIMALLVNEINIMKITTNLVKNNITPHLIILYNDLYCNKNTIDFTKLTYEIDKLDLINNYLNNDKYSLLIMELFDNNLLNAIFIDKIINDSKKIHIDAQVFISILTFHNKVKHIHNDVQYKNMFYKKIDINEDIDEYFYYKIFNKNIYIKNVGYLIVLGDYGFSKKIDKTNNNVLKDYEYIFNITGNTEEEFFNYLLENTEMFKTQLNNGETAINKIPYLIYSSMQNSPESFNSKRNNNNLQVSKSPPRSSKKPKN